MNWKFESIRVSKWIIFVLIMMVAASLAGYMAYSEDKRTFWPGILAGLCSGLITLLVDKWLDRKELKFLGARDYIEKTISSREDQAYYQKLIGESQRQIDFLGKTGLRLLQDFADINSQYAAKRSLLAALDRKVKVRFLLAKESRLGQDSDKVAEFNRNYNEIKYRYPQYPFEVKYYDFDPAFSFFRVDDLVIFGSNFPSSTGNQSTHFSSRQTPSVVAGTLSNVAKGYIEFFQATWDAIV